MIHDHFPKFLISVVASNTIGTCFIKKIHQGNNFHFGFPLRHIQFL